MIFLNTLMRSRVLAIAFALAATSLPAFAGRPMTVDDAAIAAPGQCQLETYFLHAEHRDEYWATPACNVGGSWEFALGGAWADDTSGPHSNTARYGRVQAKTVFKEMAAGGWGVGLVLADQFRSGSSGNGDLSVNVPLSASLHGDTVLVHLNTGAMRVATTRQINATWGTGAEFKLNQRHSVTAEVFGQQRSGSHYQFGVAHALIPDHLQIDATWGNRMARGASEPIVTLGLVLQTH